MDFKVDSSVKIEIIEVFLQDLSGSIDIVNYLMIRYGENIFR